MYAIIPIDIQVGLSTPHPFWGGAHNNPDFPANTGRLVEAARSAGAPVIHVRHNSTNADSPLQVGSPAHDFQPQARPQDGEKVFEKTVNSAFIGTGLEAYLHQQGLSRLIMFGLTSDHCVSTSARMGANLGFDVIVVADACAAHPKTAPDGGVIDADTVHLVHLASLQGEFARVINTLDAVALLGA